ncbi:unnamed protein product [Paramecium sonneborni]|uniref:Uncharacterized protein n=1 Tax=Paramecium sonneborni TaxID=65129 RepID=A0A8S1PSU4_9CILI|nr:unnamed protein product [Paramecium sonneborni]
MMITLQSNQNQDYNKYITLQILQKTMKSIQGEKIEIQLHQNKKKAFQSLEQKSKVNQIFK